MKLIKEITNPQEIIQATSNVIPQLTKGDHSISWLLTHSNVIQFANENEWSKNDLFRILGSAPSLRSTFNYDIRLYGAKEAKQMGLTSKISSSSLRRDIAVVWSGGAVSDGRNCVYINLMNETDMEFNLDTNSLGIRSTSEGRYVFNYPVASEGGVDQLGSGRYYETINHFRLSEPQVGRDTVGVFIQNPTISAEMLLIVPKQISRIDLNALPQLTQ